MTEAESLESIIAPILDDVPRATLAPFLEPLLRELNGRANAVIAYGSCMSEVTRTSTSTPDFYVTVDRYRTFYSSWLHAAMNWILPPNIYHFSVNGEIAKYNVISEYDLQGVTAECARDVYHLGRFSKRIGIAWAKDTRSKQVIIDAQAAALRSIARRAYFGLPPKFSLATFIRKALGLSYEGEFRVEAPDKIDKLYEAEKVHYERAYEKVLLEMSVPPWSVKHESSGQYVRPKNGWRDFYGHVSLWRFIHRSRLRAKLRWPKSIVTVSHWVDYLLAKIERTHGIKIELTERERRHPLLYGWKYFIELRRKNVLK